jgi:DNA-binding NtrC family response regulator
MNSPKQERILLVDNNLLLLERIASELRAKSFDVVTTDSGLQAFHHIRNRSCPIDWLFTRATLSGLIDGWILADEYHDEHSDRAAVIASSHMRVSTQGHIVLKDPSPTAVIEAMRRTILQSHSHDFPISTNRQEKCAA